MNAADVRPDLTARLRPASSDPVPCKACGASSAPFGETDFNRSCEETKGVRLPPAGVAIAYRRCPACGLIFTDAFDDWTHDDFRAHIYNAAYPQVDSSSVEVRPVRNAAWFSRSFAHVRDTLAILDYGGGEGRFAADMRAAGYACESYDPVYPQGEVRPQRRFGMVTCFETLEHMPDPGAGAADIAALLADDGVIFLSTLVQPDDVTQQGMGWWYIGPRNGHVTLFSRQALAVLWGRLGFKVATLNPALHLVFRHAPPDWVRAAFAPRAG